MLAACILWEARPAKAAWSKLWASSSLSQGRPPFTTPCQLLQNLHSSTQSMTARWPSSKQSVKFLCVALACLRPCSSHARLLAGMHLAQLYYQPSNAMAHTVISTASLDNSMSPVGTAPVPSLPRNQQLRAGCSTGRLQTRAASISAVTHLHAATSSTDQVSLPQPLSGTSLSHTAVQSAQEFTLSSKPLGELKLPTSVAVPNKQLTTYPARLWRSYQPPCMALWSLSLAAQSCSLTTSPCDDPQTSEGAAAPQLDLAASAQQRSAHVQVHAETRLLSIPASHLAGFSPKLADDPCSDCCPS